MSFEISIEVLDGEFPASSWSWAYGDTLVETAIMFGASEWHWHQHSWGVVLELAFEDESYWERFLNLPSVQAALESVPEPVRGLIFHRGWGGTSGVGEPRRPKPFAGAGAAELPLPEDEPEDDYRPVWQERMRELVGGSLRPAAVR